MENYSNIKVINTVGGFNDYTNQLCYALYGDFSAPFKSKNFITEQRNLTDTVYNLSKGWDCLSHFYKFKTFNFICGEKVNLNPIPAPGGGTYISKHLLFYNDLELKPEIKSEIKKLLDILQVYTAVHYRFEDKKITDFSEADFAVNKILSESNSNILLCSDNSCFIHRWADNKKIFNFSFFNKIDKNINFSIHNSPSYNFVKYDPTNLNNLYIQKYTIIDFYLFLFAEKIISLGRGHYSKAAIALKNNLKINNLDEKNLLI